MIDSHPRARAFALAGGVAAAVMILTLIGVAIGGTGSSTPQPPMAITAALVLAAAGGGLAAWAILRTIMPIIDAIDGMTRLLRHMPGTDNALSFPTPIRLVLPTLAAAVELLVGRLQSHIETIQQQAMRDPVTELPNRVHLRRTVERHLRQARAEESRSVLLFIDLDRFKGVNDSLGHAQGDVLLGMFAARMRVLLVTQQASDGDADAPLPAVSTLARHGGDEFTLLLSRTDAVGGERVARRILRALEEPFEIAGQSIVIGASIGIACFPADGTDYDTLLRNADTAMYHAKEQGRNQSQLYLPAMNERARDRLVIEVQLREALAREQFELFYQPQVRSADGALVAAEVLIRWRHPQHGLRMPASFIGVAEETGLIVDIGRWVIAEATRTLARWRAQGMCYGLSVNVSPRQIARPDFVAHVRDCIEATGAPATLLEFEITESLVMSNDPATIEKIAQLRELGVSIAIDDFGTGYSNLARLKELPIDRLKIDRSLIQDITTSSDARTIIQAIVSLSHGLGYECVAEGVEALPQADILGVIGCEMLQGYVIAQPADEASFLAWAARHEARVTG